MAKRKYEDKKRNDWDWNKQDENKFFGKTIDGRDKTDDTFEQISADLNQSTIGGLSFNPSVIDLQIRHELGRIVGMEASAWRKAAEPYQQAYIKQYGSLPRLGYLNNPAPDLSPLGINLRPGATIRDVEGYLVSTAFEPEILKATQRFARDGRDIYQDKRQAISTRILEALRGTGIQGPTEFGFDPNRAKAFDPSNPNNTGFNGYMRDIFGKTMGIQQRADREDARNSPVDIYGNDIGGGETNLPSQLIYNDPYLENEPTQEENMTLDQFRNAVAGKYRANGMSVQQARELANSLTPSDFAGLNDEQIKAKLELNGIPMPGRVSSSQASIGSYGKPKVYQREYGIFNPAPSNPDDPRHYKNFVTDVASYSGAHSLDFPSIVVGGNPIEKAQNAVRIMNIADGYQPDGTYSKTKDRFLFHNDENEYKKFVKQIKRLQQQVNLGRGGLGGELLEDGDSNPILSASTVFAGDVRQQGPFASIIPNGTKFYLDPVTGSRVPASQQELISQRDIPYSDLGLSEEDFEIGKHQVRVYPTPKLITSSLTRLPEHREGGYQSLVNNLARNAKYAGERDYIGPEPISRVDLTSISSRSNSILMQSAETIWDAQAEARSLAAERKLRKTYLSPTYGPELPPMYGPDEKPRPTQRYVPNIDVADPHEVARQLAIQNGEHVLYEDREGEVFGTTFELGEGSKRDRKIFGSSRHRDALPANIDKRTKAYRAALALDKLEQGEDRGYQNNRIRFNNGLPIEETSGPALEKEIQKGLDQIYVARIGIDPAQAKIQIEMFRSKNQQYADRSTNRYYPPMDVSEPEGPPDEFAGMTSARDYATPERFGWNAPIPEGFKVVQSNTSRMSADGLPMHAWTSPSTKTIYYNPAGVAEMYRDGSMFGMQRDGIAGIPKSAARGPEEAARIVSLHESKHADRLRLGVFNKNDRIKEENIANVYALGHKGDKFDPDMHAKQINSGQLMIVPDMSPDPNQVIFKGAPKAGSIGFPTSYVGNDELHEEPEPEPNDLGDITDALNDQYEEMLAEEEKNAAYHSEFTDAPKGHEGNLGSWFSEQAGLNGVIPSNKEALDALYAFQVKHPGWKDQFAGVLTTSWKQFDAWFSQLSTEDKNLWRKFQATHHYNKKKNKEAYKSDPLNAMYSRSVLEKDATRNRLKLPKGTTEADLDRMYPDAASKALAADRVRTESGVRAPITQDERAAYEAYAATLDVTSTDNAHVGETVIAGGAVPPVAPVPGPYDPGPAMSPTRRTPEESLAIEAEYLARRAARASGVHAGVDHPATNRRYNEHIDGEWDNATESDYFNRVNIGTTHGAAMFQNIVDNMSLKSLTKPGSSLGVDRATYGGDGTNTYDVAAVEFKDILTGDVTLTNAQSRQALAAAKSASTRAIADGGYGGMDGTDQALTFKARVNDYIKAFGDDLMKHAGNDDVAKEISTHVVKAAKIIAGDIENRVAGKGRADPSWRQSQGDVNYVSGLKNVERMSNNKDGTMTAFGQRLQDMNIDVEEAATGPLRQFALNGVTYQTGVGERGGRRGGNGGSSGGRRGGNDGSSGGGGDDDFMQSIYRTPLGKFQMAAFMGKMIWQETGGAVMNSAQSNRDYASQFAVLDTAGNGQLSQAARENFAMEAQGIQSNALAYRQFGSVAEMGSALRSGPAGTMLNRLGNDGLVAAGIGMLGGIGGYLAGDLGLGVMAGATGGAAAAVGFGAMLPIAAAVGATLAGGEILNSSMGKDEISGVGIQNTARGMTIAGSGFSAADWGNASAANQAGFTGDGQTAYLKSIGIVGRAAEAKYFNSGIMGSMFSGWGAAMARSPEESRFANMGARVASNFGIDPTKIADQLGQMMSMSGPDGDNEAVYTQALQSAQKRGITVGSMMEQGSGYAMSQGAIPGTSEYLQRMTQVSDMSPVARNDALSASAYSNALSSQLSYVTGGMSIERLTSMRESLGLTNQTRVGYANSMLQAFEASGTTYSADPAMAAQQYQTALAPYAGHSMPQQRTDLAAANLANQVGMNGDQQKALINAVASNGFSPEMNQGLINGNAYDWSAAVRLSGKNQDGSLSVYEQYDARGRRSGIASGAAVASFMQFQQTDKNAMGDQAYLQSQGMNSKYASAFALGGTRGMQDTYDNTMYGYQMASIGLQYQGLAAQATYNWGSGTAANPSSGSSWGIQDRQISLQNSSTLAGLSYSRKSLDTNNQFAIQNEELSRTSQLASRSYQNYDMGFSHQTDLISRANTQSEWQYQKQTNALNYDWSMQDIDEQIRRSSGRDRSLLIRQRDRQTTSENMQLTETSREHTVQETLWKREDDHYKVQADYIKSNQALEDKSYQLGKTQRETIYKMESDDLNRRTKEAKENIALDKEARDLQRQFQAEELERSKQALGIQAAQAVEQHNYNEAQKVANRGIEDMVAGFGAITGSAEGMKQMVASIMQLSGTRFKLTKISDTEYSLNAYTVAPRGGH